MLIRFLLFAVVAGLAIYAYQLILGPKPLRLSTPWKQLAQRNETFAQALAIRTAIGRLLLAGDRTRLAPTLANVDRVLDAMYLMLAEQEKLGLAAEQHSGTTDAIHELKAIYEELKDEFDAKKAGQLDRARARLAESTQDLKERNEVRRELDRDLDG
ncbi:MAG: hypothetical protein VX589_15055 [Myxococcota bacterium]|nr:hypothetical protein [Myxococcota bacterium]